LIHVDMVCDINHRQKKTLDRVVKTTPKIVCSELTQLSSYVHREIQDADEHNIGPGCSTHHLFKQLPTDR